MVLKPGGSAGLARAYLSLRKRACRDRTGLTTEDVSDRVQRGQTNASGERTSRSFAEILRANIFTRFNFILGILLAAILAVGQLQDALFGIVVVSNSLIGIVQEVRAKRTLDQLAVLNTPRARVVRDGLTSDIAVDEVVLDDIVDLHTWRPSRGRRSRARIRRHADR